MFHDICLCRSVNVTSIIYILGLVLERTESKTQICSLKISALCWQFLRKVWEDMNRWTIPQCPHPHMYCKYTNVAWWERAMNTDAPTVYRDLFPVGRIAILFFCSLACKHWFQCIVKGGRGTLAIGCNSEAVLFLLNYFTQWRILTEANAVELADKYVKRKCKFVLVTFSQCFFCFAV